MIEPTVARSAEPLAQPGPNVLAVASGKGGVGKTWFSLTLAHAIARRGGRCLVFDGDLGLANIDVQLGLSPANDLGHVLVKGLPLAKAISPVPKAGFDIIAGRSGSGGLAAMSTGQVHNLGRGIVSLAPNYHRVILDLGAGLDAQVRTLSARAATAIVVVNEEPTALTDAYAFIKLTRQHRPTADVRVVVNMANSTNSGERVYGALRKACETFLKVSPPLLGIVQRDDRVRDSIIRQCLLLDRHPNAPAAQAVEAIARTLTSES